jgi:gamma-glutamylputrescine oxidase
MDLPSELNQAELSLWERESFSDEIDLLVVGAGIVGSSAALSWKKQYPDDRVVVIDKGIRPEGASTRNAGFACIGSVSEHIDDIQKSGEEIVLNRVLRRWKGLQLLRKTLGEKEIGYEPCGGHEIFTDNDLCQICYDSIELMNGRLKELTGESDIYKKVSVNGYPAIFNRLEGAVHAGKLMKALHKELQKEGISIRWNHAAREVNEQIAVLESGHSLSAKRILVAVNGFTKRLADLPVTPARGMVMVTKPINNLAWKGIFHHNKGFVYFRNIGDRLLIGGARNIDAEGEAIDQFGINPAIKKWLINFTDQVLKLPKDREIEQEWSGIMGFTPDKEPLVARTDKGFWVAAGLSGMGVAIGMEVGRKVVEEMIDPKLS